MKNVLSLELPSWVLFQDFEKFRFKEIKRKSTKFPGKFFF